MKGKSHNTMTKTEDFQNKWRFKKRKRKYNSFHVIYIVNSQNFYITHNYFSYSNYNMFDVLIHIYSFYFEHRCLSFRKFNFFSYKGWWRKSFKTVLHSYIFVICTYEKIRLFYIMSTDGSTILACSNALLCKYYLHFTHNKNRTHARGACAAMKLGRNLQKATLLKE